MNISLLSELHLLPDESIVFRIFLKQSRRDDMIIVLTSISISNSVSVSVSEDFFGRTGI